MRQDLPPVKDTLSGEQATFRDGPRVMTIQGDVTGLVRLNINGNVIEVEADKLLQAVRRVTGAVSPQKGEE